MYLEVEVGAKSTRHDIPDWVKEHFPMVVFMQDPLFSYHVSNCVLSDYLRHTVITEVSFLKY